ncbi:MULTISPECIES: hypothetical protein [Spirulina sp. CCY15215]|uniref:hypothetical protein n=1 Tax=Spirulina sp. CCY15215 TaxID=2767591 RepID=UPI0019503154|nr:hypothetical protein [Spirulina major]
MRVSFVVSKTEKFLDFVLILPTVTLEKDAQLLVFLLYSSEDFLTRTDVILFSAVIGDRPD